MHSCTPCGLHVRFGVPSCLCLQTCDGLVYCFQQHALFLADNGTRGRTHSAEGHWFLFRGHRWMCRRLCADSWRSENFFSIHCRLAICKLLPIHTKFCRTAISKNMAYGSLVYFVALNFLLIAIFLCRRKCGVGRDCHVLWGDLEQRQLHQ